MAPANHKRPIFLNLFQIRLPVSGVVSILHRVTGVMLFLCIPVSLWMLNASLTSEQQFQHLVDVLHHPVSITLVILIVWALLHHLLAGIRHLLLDLDIGVGKAMSTKSSWLVAIAAPLLALALLLSIYL